MMEHKPVLLAACARLLGYPCEDFQEMKEELLAAVQEEMKDNELASRFGQAAEAIFSVPPKELQEIYVWTFDWKEKTGLYLTAHELGDSRERGAALILLQHIVRDAGFMMPSGELCDFIPLLYELLAVRSDNVHVRALELRLAAATERIRKHLSEDSPYSELLNFLMTDVFEVPTEEEIRMLESKRESADLDELPYPILFGMDGTARSDSGLPVYKTCNGMGV
ncbi:nitrate reductase molybdenum cofactor assembly chaperone [Paenibacillus sp. FSL L8-0638]|uniref:nitrate reductase molybdenum cofactor assembly chaperone n=1 Tax=Paenibacillus TaxID=44249 RepID=UPI0031599565